MTTSRSGDPQAFEALLRAVVRAARAGNLTAARVLARALTNEYPNESRAWVALAGVGATPHEQRDALERAQALDPENERVRQALTHLPTASEAAAPVVTSLPPVSTSSSTIDAPITSPLIEAQPPVDRPARSRTFLRWLPWIILLLLLLPTLGYAMTTVWRQSPVAAPALTPTLADNVSAATGAVPTVAATALAANLTSVPTSIPASIPTQDLSNTQVTLPLPSQSPTPVPQLLPVPTALPPGTMLALDGWHVSLPRQDYVLALDGGIGDTAAHGRFVLAVLALANTQDQPRRIPADLFVLLDNRGRMYHPQPALSSAYLAAYGRAQRGDLSMEEALPGGGGFFSVPVVFDVPVDATGLRLSLGDGSVGGWDVLAAPQP